MLKSTLCALFIILLSLNHASAEQFRDFTDKNGRTMRAKPVNVIGSKVRIEREDGQEFNVDVKMFSEKDQEYLNKWILTHLKKQDRLLKVNAKGGGTKKKKQQSGATEYERWQGYYDITVQNDSDITLADLTVEYRYFVFDDAIAAHKRSQGDERKISGKSEIKLLGPRSKVELQTVKTDMSASELESGWYYTSGGDEKSKDKLDGVWVRIYKDKLLICEYADPSNLGEKLKW